MPKGYPNKSEAKKSNKKATESKTSGEPAEPVAAEETKPTFVNPWDDPEWRRLEIVDPKLVLATLEKNGLKIAERELDRTTDLSFYYVHEAQKKTFRLVRCVPNDPDDGVTGCGFMSDEALDSCPFCGSGADIVAVPKDPPKADRDIELNVKAAAAKVESKKEEPKKSEPKKSGGVAKVSSKDVKKKKEERGEKAEDKPAQPAPEAPKADAIVSAEPEVVAIDLPSESAGGTASDLDRISSEIDARLEIFSQNQAVVMWDIGKKFAEIRDKKLWSTVRHENGDFAYRNFSAFVAQRFHHFDFTPDYAMIMIRCAAEMTKEQALALGITKAKAILDASNARNSEPLTEAQKNELLLLAPGMSVSELRAKIKRMQTPQLPATSSAPVVAASLDEDDEDRDDEDRDDEDDEEDDEPESSRPTVNKPAAKPAQMTSVSFEKKEFSIPLVQKGSQVRVAKKIQDEPHGTLSVPGGTKIHFKLVIGDDGQICIEGKVETPY